MRSYNITDFCEECNKIATEHGWWDDLLLEDRVTYTSSDCIETKLSDYVDIDAHNNYVYATKLALISAEVSEAIEDLRAGEVDHLGEELADIAIRLFDFAYQMDYDLEAEIHRKMKINIERPYKHGKRF